MSGCAHDKLLMDQAVLRQVPVERRLLFRIRQLSMQKKVCRVIEVPALCKLLHIILHSSVSSTLTDASTCHYIVLHTQRTCRTASNQYANSTLQRQHHKAVL